jgi:hypothetical protein
MSRLGFMAWWKNYSNFFLRQNIKNTTKLFLIVGIINSGELLSTVIISF